jgi:2-dehydropantoate 2-reductase
MEENNERLKIVFYGAGAIGATLCGWLTLKFKQVYLLARGENARILRSNGLTLYEREAVNQEQFQVNVIENLDEVDSIDIVVIAVKNYNLEEVAKDIYEKLNDKPTIIALQNGVENQKILPKYFSKIIYGVIVISAWQDNPGVFGNRGKNLIILGTIDNKHQDLLEQISKIFNLALPTKITKNIQDAAHSKLLMNLLNSIFTLIRVDDQDDSSIFKLWKIYVNCFLEGVKVVQVAGFREHKLKNLPTWRTMEFVNKLDKTTAINTVKKSLRFYRLNSMAQDMVIRQKKQSELETLNGYLIELADSYSLEIPLNKMIYKLCNENFSKDPYEPLEIDVVWEQVSDLIT